MGGLFKSPKAKPVAQPVVPVATPAPAQSTAPTPESSAEEAARRQRVQALVQQRRGRASTIATSPRGLLTATANLPVRKSLLGE